MIEFDCPNCQRHLHVPNDLGGRRAPCPQCQQSLRIPELDEVAAPAEQPAPPPAPQQPAPPPPEPTPVEPVIEPTAVEAAPEPTPVEPEPDFEPEAPPAEPAPPIEAETPLPVFGIGPASEPEATAPVDEPEPAPEAPLEDESVEPEIETASTPLDAPTLDLEELLAAEQDASHAEPLPAAPTERPSRPTAPPHRAKVVRAAPPLKEPLDDTDDDDDASPGARRPMGFDVAALILGLVAVLCSPLGYVTVVPAAPAVVFAFVGLAQAKRASKPKGKASLGLLLGFAGGALAVLTAMNMVKLVPTLQDYHDRDARRQSAARLQQIGKALAEYSLNHNGAIAPDLQSLVDEDILPARGLLCPGRGSGRDSDYFYHPPSKNTPLDTIVMCEFIDCGRPDVRVFLYFDGGVDHFPEAAFQLLANKHLQNQAFFDALAVAEADAVANDGAEGD